MTNGIRPNWWLATLALVALVGCQKDKEIQYVDRPVPGATPVVLPEERPARDYIVESDRLSFNALFLAERAHLSYGQELRVEIRLFAQDPTQGSVASLPSIPSEMLTRQQRAWPEMNVQWTSDGLRKFSKVAIQIEVPGWRYKGVARRLGLADQDPGYVQMSLVDVNGRTVGLATTAMRAAIGDALTPSEGYLQDGQRFHTRAEMRRLLDVRTFWNLISDYHRPELTRFSQLAFSDEELKRYSVREVGVSPAGGLNGFHYFGAGVELRAAFQ